MEVARQQRLPGIVLGTGNTTRRMALLRGMIMVSKRLRPGRFLTILVDAGRAAWIDGNSLASAWAGRAAKFCSLFDFQRLPMRRLFASGYLTAFFAIFAAWLILSAPWLSGEVTIPYDAKAHFQAQIQFLANALHSGQSPFWTHNVFVGSPQIADPQSLIFSPAFLLAYFEAVPSFRQLDGMVLAYLGIA